MVSDTFYPITHCKAAFNTARIVLFLNKRIWWSIRLSLLLTGPSTNIYLTPHGLHSLPRMGRIRRLATRVVAGLEALNCDQLL